MAIVLPISALKALVNLYIQANGVKAITGPVLQGILNDIIDSLESDYDASIATAGGAFLKLDGSTPMAGNLDIASYQILLQFLKIASNQLYLVNSANQAAILDISAITTNKTITIQNKNHTIAGLDDIATAIAALVDSSPSTLDTLNKLAAALGDDPNFATTITNLIATKLPLAGGVMSGDIELNGNAVKNSTGSVLLKSSAGLVNVQNIISGFIGVLNFVALTANRTISFQDKDHTVAGLDDIPLQFAVTDTTTPIIVKVHDIVVFSPTNNPISEIIVTLGTPQATGTIYTVDILKNGASILSTLATIDNTEYTTLTATTPLVISNTTRAKGDRYTVQTTQIGDGTAKQLGVIIL